MSQKKQKKKIYYKRVEIHGEKRTLQALLEDVFDNKKATHFAKSRMESVNFGGTVNRLVNEFIDRERMFFGQMLMFETGRAQGFVTLDETAESYAVDALTTDKIRLEGEGRESEQKAKEARKVREFVDSFLYFSVMGNHLAVVQSRSLTSRELEAHLQWLLSDKACVIDKSSALILHDKPLKSTIEKLERKPAKKITLGAPVLTGDGVPLDIRGNEESSGETKGVKFFPRGMGFDVLRSLMGKEWFDQQEFTEELDSANLRVKLEVTYSRKTSNEGQKILDSVATSLRHTDSADVKIELKGGGSIKGEDLRVSGEVDFVYLKDKLDSNVLYDNMYKWMMDKIDDEEIDLSEGDDTLI